MKKRMISALLVLGMISVLLSPGIALAGVSPNVDLGVASIIDGKYYYANATVSGDNIRTLLINFSGNVTAGDEIILPSAPDGFTVSATSAGNDYVKRINLDTGATAGDVQAYLRGVGFTLASASQSVEASITAENVQYDAFFNIDKQHYYIYVPDLTSS